MERTRDNRGFAAPALGTALGTAGVFEVLTMLETQDAAIQAASPWREDPFHTVVSLAGFAVPALAAAVLLRLLVGRVKGDADRAGPTVRAAAVMTATIGLALAAEWAAVPAVSSWTASAAAQVGGLATTTALITAPMVLLVRRFRLGGAPKPGPQDWVDDMALLGRRIPVLRHWAGPSAVAWVRRRTMTVFVGLSLTAAAALTGAQALGEHETDPLLIAWLLIAVTAANLAFCVITNAMVGFIARAPRSRLRHRLETSALTGCLAVLVAIGFHDALWSALGTGPLTVPDLVFLTLGAGLTTSVVTSLLLTVRPSAGVGPA